VNYKGNVVITDVDSSDSDLHTAFISIIHDHLVDGRENRVIMTASFYDVRFVSSLPKVFTCNCVFKPGREPEWTDEMRDWIDQQRREWKASLKEDQP